MKSGRGVIFVLLGNAQGIRSIPVDVEYIREGEAFALIDLSIPYAYLREMDSDEVEAVLRLTRKRLEKNPL